MNRLALMIVIIAVSVSFISANAITSGDITAREVHKDKDLVRAQTRFGDLSSTCLYYAVLSLEKSAYLLSKDHPELHVYEIDIFLSGGRYWATVRLEKGYTDMIKKYKSLESIWKSEELENKTLCFLAKMPAISGMSLKPRYTYKSLKHRMKKAGCGKKK